MLEANKTYLLFSSIYPPKISASVDGGMKICFHNFHKDRSKIIKIRIETFIIHEEIEDEH